MPATQLIPRRKFFSWGCAAAALLSLRSTPRASVLEAGSDGSSDLMPPLDQVSSGTFAPFVGDTFLLHPSAGPAQVVTLTKAQDSLPYKGSKPLPTGLRLPFALKFLAREGSPLTQGTYALQHQRLGTFSLFLVPIGPPSAQPLYEAVFG